MKEFFTTYRLENILELTGKYSIRIYEILKSNEFKKTLEIEITDLVRILKLTKTYFTFQHLRERIVEPAKKEINAKTDIMFDYEPIKTGKKVTALKFTIKPNLKNRAKQEQETPKQLTKLWNPDIADDLRADIQSIQSEFQKRYKGELLDKFVEKMLAEKGYQNVQKCIRDYENYIPGRNIKNISGDFYRFVMDGYQKPTQYKGDKPQRDNFEQREYNREELEKYYVDLAAIDIEDKTVKDEPTVKTIEDNKPETELPRREKSNPILDNIKNLLKKL